MTRDEHRKACIEAMARAICKSRGHDPDELILLDQDGQRHPMWLDFECDATEAFDALNGIARVNPIEATKEMRLTAELRWDAVEIYSVMTRAGDLTNPPEEKP